MPLDKSLFSRKRIWAGEGAPLRCIGPILPVGRIARGRVGGADHVVFARSKPTKQSSPTAQRFRIASLALAMTV